MRCEKRIEVNGGFCLVVLWFAAINGWSLLAVILGAAAIHEIGHWAVLRGLGGSVAALKLTMLGAEMRVDSTRLSYGREIAGALAGPAANFLAAITLSRLSDHMVFAGANAVLGLFNLIPVRPLDGGRTLALTAEWFFGPIAGARLSRWMDGVFGTALAAGLGCIMWYTGGSLWLIPPACGLLWSAWKDTHVDGLFGNDFLRRKRGRNMENSIKK